MPRATIAEGYDISRVIKGGWHLAGGHGEVDPAAAVADMAAFVAAGITTFDCADIYTGVEELIGRFRAAEPQLAQNLQVHTKFVPDLSELATLAPAAIDARIDRSCARLGVERLDLVQFHWWDYETPGYVEAALQLTRLREAGKIRHIGLTNFDTPHLAELVAAGVPVKTIQVQYSLLDARPETAMVAFCQEHGISLLCYGTVAGGFLSERWLGREAPALETLTNRSLTKYRLIIDEFGGWELFQTLLETLARVAARRGTDIATIASAAMLGRTAVAAVIVGATNRAHLPANQRIAELQLSREDMAEIDAVLAQRQGPPGEVYALERDRTGPHGRIMKYELGKPAA
ncbi:aldo/keto reductase [Devosia sp.]|uniref:aldo/keto reductase n=1 Tax=Devosia sp. TaxID=1871048 RepID=UPI003A95D0DD